MLTYADVSGLGRWFPVGDGGTTKLDAPNGAPALGGGVSRSGGGADTHAKQPHLCAAGSGNGDRNNGSAIWGKPYGTGGGAPSQESRGNRSSLARWGGSEGGAGGMDGGGRSVPRDTASMYDFGSAHWSTARKAADLLLGAQQ